MRIPVVGARIGGHAPGRAIFQTVNVELVLPGFAGVIHDARLAINPARIGIPNRLARLVGKRLEVRDRALLRVEVPEVKCVAGFGEFGSSQVLEADLCLLIGNCFLASVCT